MAIKLEDVVKLLAQNICDERWGQDSEKHWPGYWDYACAESNIKALQAAGYDIVKNEVPKGNALNSGGQTYETPQRPRLSVPAYFTDHPEYGNKHPEYDVPDRLAKFEPPVEEPIPACTRARKKRFETKESAVSANKGLEQRFGANYQNLYPYECSSGGHRHLSHYRQGKAKCPVCQLPKPAWRGGESYWVIAKHIAITTVCNGTGSRVYDKGQTL